MPTAIEDVKTEEQKVPVDAKAAVRAAVEELEPDKSSKEDKQESKDGEQTKEDKKPAQLTEEEKEAEKVEFANARQLYQALKNPESRDAVIEFIAKQGGYTKGVAAVETPKEIKEAKDDIKAALQEALGDEFSFLTDKLGPALDKIITSKLKEGLKETEEALAAQEQEKLNAQSEKALTKLSKDFFGEGQELPENVRKGMSTFMDKVPPQSDMSVADYLEYAFFSTIGKLGLTRKDPKTEKKIQQNRTDAPARLASDRTVPAKEAQDNSKILSRKQAIAAAIQSLADSDT